MQIQTAFLRYTRLAKGTLLVSFLSVSSIVKAGGEKYQLTLLLSPTSEWIRISQSANASIYNTAWSRKLSYNFGFEYKRFFDPSLSFSTGFIYMNKGFRSVFPDLSEPGRNSVMLVSVHIAAVPFYINIHHRLRRRTEMIYTAGLAGGYAFRQLVRSRNFTGEDTPEQGLLDFKSGISNVRLFNDVYAGLHIGLGISQYIKNRLVLIVQPMYKFQLNNARDWSGQFSSSDPFVARLNSFGIDFKIGYFFTRNVQNRKKQF